MKMLDQARDSIYGLCALAAALAIFVASALDVPPLL